MLLKSLDVQRRNVVPELMDASDLDQTLHTQALRGLERINRLSFAERPLWREIETYATKSPHKTIRVLDIATGAGDTPIRLKQLALKKGVSIEFFGCDMSLTALDYARQKAEAKNVPVTFFHHNIFEDQLKENYDIVMSSLFLHHLQEADIQQLIHRLVGTNVKMILWSDLKRSHRGLLMAYFAAHTFSRSPIVHFDAPQSVRAAYTSSEIESLMSRSGLNQFEIKSVWPQRYLFVWKKECF